VATVTQAGQTAAQCLILSLFAAELFNLEFELYRTASVVFSDSFFLFYVSFDEQILQRGYPVPFFLDVIFVLLHRQSSPQRF